MTRIFGPLALCAAMLVSGVVPTAMADEADAESCLRTKIWDGYEAGWAVRTATSATLAQGEYRIYLVTLYAGNEYKILACADGAAKNVDLVLHDADGNVVQQDETSDRQPALTFKPQTTDTFFVAVHATELAEGKGEKSGVGMAVTYR
ncbi:MAG TPA: hypothetical protein QGF58_07620 [Myxococcota bacterium]|nr:hypothetical protein [Myxococcota bacterium]